jgi:hypothetical protein
MSATLMLTLLKPAETVLARFCRSITMLQADVLLLG